MSEEENKPNPNGANGSTSDPREEECLVCGYSKHLERCHIIPKFCLEYVDGFQHLYKFNSKNIVMLCKNHHWEYDHDLIDDNDYKKIIEFVILSGFQKEYEKLICSSVVLEENYKDYIKAKGIRFNNWIYKQRKKLENLDLLI